MFGRDVDWWNTAMLLSLGGGALAACAIVVTTFAVWNTAMLLSLGGGALAAFAILVTTFAVVKLQKQEAAVLRWQLDRESQKRAPRLLTDEQKTVLLAELSGKIKDVNVVVQRDVEAQAFAMQLEIVLQEAGAVLHTYQMAAGETLPAPAGLVMYKPGGAMGEADMKEDPLYRALKAANLFGGSTSGPFLSIEQQTMGPRLPPDQHILYVGQKPPF